MKNAKVDEKVLVKVERHSTRQSDRSVCDRPLKIVAIFSDYHDLVKNATKSKEIRFRNNDPRTFKCKRIHGSLGLFFRLQKLSTVKKFLNLMLENFVSNRAN